MAALCGSILDRPPRVRGIWLMLQADEAPTERPLRSRAGLAAQPKESTAGLSAAPPAQESHILPCGRRPEKRTALSGPQSAPRAPRGPLPAVFRARRH
ncbi:hypothetical protein M885DRAFT_623274 [Pelagophyceae sp. CCMP2097]|nr:hypothetical protein M885DRAFT_623274 [Pelagophyceae sp. CCMP2097]